MVLSKLISVRSKVGGARFSTTSGAPPEAISVMATPPLSMAEASGAPSFTGVIGAPPLVTSVTGNPLGIPASIQCRALGQVLLPIGAFFAALAELVLRL